MLRKHFFPVNNGLDENNDVATSTLTRRRRTTATTTTMTETTTTPTTALKGSTSGSSKGYTRAKVATDAAWDALAKPYASKMELLREQHCKIEEGYEELEEAKVLLVERNGGTHISPKDILEINAGGKVISVMRSTLIQMEGSILEAIFSGRWENQLQRDDENRYFLDVNPKCFRTIVDYLNELKISSPDAPPDPLHIDKDHEVFLHRLLDMFGLNGLILGSSSPSCCCFPGTCGSTRHGPYRYSGLDSTILNDLETSHIDALYRFLREDDIAGDLKLLYRASDDGWNASTFHEICDMKGQTVTIIRSTSGYVFGGYADASWTSDGCYKTSPKAFLFALHCYGGLAPTKMKQKEGAIHTQTAVCHGHAYGPTFGGGYDIYVADQANCNTNSSTRIPNSYECPPGQNGRTFLTGSSNFQASEIEVFVLLTPHQPSSCTTTTTTTITNHHNLQLLQSQQIDTMDNTNINMYNNKIKQKANEPWRTMTFHEFPNALKLAMQAEQMAIMDEWEQLFLCQYKLEQESMFIQYFTGDTTDIVQLNVSGTRMAVKRSTLGQYQDSVLAKQFDSVLWSQPSQQQQLQKQIQQQNNIYNKRNNVKPICEWNVQEVTAWVNNIQQLFSDLSETVQTKEITGAELLALMKKKSNNNDNDCKDNNTTETLDILLDAIQQLNSENKKTNTHKDHQNHQEDQQNKYHHTHHHDGVDETNKFNNTHYHANNNTNNEIHNLRQNNDDDDDNDDNDNNNNSNPITFIEHSHYCFGKIVDQLRLRAMRSSPQDPLPPLPYIRSQDRKRFKKIVEYYFPMDSSLFIENKKPIIQY